MRLRKEYLYRKSLEDQERTIHEKKKQLKRALDDGKPIPTEIRKDESQLRQLLQFDDEAHDKVASHEDDEYKWASVEDPKIMITTSHSPSSRLKQFAKEIKLVFPNSQRLNRGNYVISQLINACVSNAVTDLIILHEHRGEPDGLVISHLPYGPTAYFSLSNTVMRHDIPNVNTLSEVYPHLIFNNFQSKLGKRVMNILKYLFPVPKEESKRVITFANQDDFISFRHHTFSKTNGGKGIDLHEVGPRLEMRLYELKQGTVDQLDADTEWKLRPYMNTASKRKSLANAES